MIARFRCNNEEKPNKFWKKIGIMCKICREDKEQQNIGCHNVER